MQQQDGKIDRFLGVALIVSALVVAGILSIRANLDLINGRYVLFMDERLTFDGVKRILHPESLLMLIDQIIDGRDHRYGRILWNLSSLFSFIPELIWGDAGQIFATRMTQAIAQLAAFTILVFTFLRSWILRGLGLWTLIALPFTAYYAIMPKPEPLQILFLSVFLLLSFKHSLRFGYYWIFLGLAFGAKISVFTLIPFLILVGLIQQLNQPEWIDFPVQKDNQLGLKRSFQCGLLVLGIYQILYGINSWHNSEAFASGNYFSSTLLVPVAFGICLILAPLLTHIMEQHQLFQAPLTWLRTLGIFLLGWGIAVPIIVFKLPSSITIWLGRTFLATGHGADNTTINALSWIQYAFSSWSSIPPIFLALLALVSINILLITTVFAIRGRSLRLNPLQIKWNTFAATYPGLLLFVFSAFLAVPILVLVKRLWGLYLHAGSVLLVVAVLSCCERLIRDYLTKRSNRIILLSIFLYLILQVTSTTFYLVPAMATEMKAYAQQTSSPEYLQKHTEYDYLISLFNRIAQSFRRQLVISYDPRLFIPDSNNEWRIVEFWGPFNAWNLKPDLIVMYESRSPLANPPPVGSVSYQPWLVAYESYRKHVSNENQACEASPCYSRLPSEVPGLLILGKNRILRRVGELN